MSIRRTFILRGPEQAKLLQAFLKANAAGCAQAGRPMSVTVAEHKAKRSNEANARYWAMLGEIAEQAFVNGQRFSNESWHEHFARMYIGCEELPSGDLKALSSTTLNVEQFGNYMAKIEAFAATDLGVQFLAHEHA